MLVIGLVVISLAMGGTNATKCDNLSLINVATAEHSFLNHQRGRYVPAFPEDEIPLENCFIIAAVLLKKFDFLDDAYFEVDDRQDLLSNSYLLVLNKLPFRIGKVSLKFCQHPSNPRYFTTISSAIIKPYLGYYYYKIKKLPRRLGIYELELWNYLRSDFSYKNFGKYRRETRTRVRDTYEYAANHISATWLWEIADRETELQQIHEALTSGLESIENEEGKRHLIRNFERLKREYDKLFQNKYMLDEIRTVTAHLKPGNVHLLRPKPIPQFLLTIPSEGTQSDGTRREINENSSSRVPNSVPPSEEDYISMYSNTLKKGGYVAKVEENPAETNHYRTQVRKAASPKRGTIVDIESSKSTEQASSKSTEYGTNNGESSKKKKYGEEAVLSESTENYTKTMGSSGSAEYGTKRVGSSKNRKHGTMKSSAIENTEHSKSGERGEKKSKSPKNTEYGTKNTEESSSLRSTEGTGNEEYSQSTDNSAEKADSSESTEVRKSISDTTGGPRYCGTNAKSSTIAKREAINIKSKKNAKSRANSNFSSTEEGIENAVSSKSTDCGTGMAESSESTDNDRRKTSDFSASAQSGKTSAREFRGK